jgi:excisionase family DNA binding protein
MDKTEETQTDTAWMTYRQAQGYANIGRTTMTRLVSTGDVKAARVGRAVRISRQSLEDFMETHATQPRLPGFDDID